ncbi:MAG TPA: hypothetical protein VNA89_08445 [Gemmatimonadaceae bacterium]|nr:hypothetical protein [Gemmatimonadaceae bacterium]
MHRSTTALAVLLAAALARPVEAQWLKAPTLVFQPGVITANVISAPDDADAISGFNVRFTMVVPTASPLFNLVMGTQFLPNGLDGNDDNRPIFYYGGIIPVGPINAYQQFLQVLVNPLGVYAMRRSEGERQYTHEFVLELALIANVGKYMMPNMGVWSNLGAYLLFDQQITGLAEDANGDTDRFNPVVLSGLTLPIAPWPGK